MQPQESARAFDDEAFTMLVTSHQRALYQYILTMVPHCADADEILQETNLAIWRRAADFLVGSNFRAWSYKIAYHKVLAFCDRKRREALVFSEDLIDALATEALATADVQESRTIALKHCLERLQPADRDLLHQYYYKNVTGSDLAVKLSRPVGSIYKSLWRIRRILLECISRRMVVEARG